MQDVQKTNYKKDRNWKKVLTSVIRCDIIIKLSGESERINE